MNYAPVFHPGVTDLGSAATCALGVSEERAGVDITVQLVPTATITGRITSTTGALPPAPSINLIPAGAYTELLAGAGLRGMTTQPRADGIVRLRRCRARRLHRQGKSRRWRRPRQRRGRRCAGAVGGGGRQRRRSGRRGGAHASARRRDQRARRVRRRKPSPAELQSLWFMLMPPGSGGQLLSTRRRPRRRARDASRSPASSPTRINS